MGPLPTPPLCIGPVKSLLDGDRDCPKSHLGIAPAWRTARMKRKLSWNVAPSCFKRTVHLSAAISVLAT